MGNRACVIFYDSRRISPTVYLHWHGESIPAWLEELKSLMDGRFDDAEYAAAPSSAYAISTSMAI